MNHPDKPPGTVLITGAARRIGRALALDLSRAGWTIAIHYRNSAPAALLLVEEIESAGGHAQAFQADLIDAEAPRALVSNVKAVFGPPTVLINNASEFLPDTVQSLDNETWDLHLGINLKAPVFLAQAIAAGLPEGCEGNIINIIDQRVWNLTQDFFSYTISKAGLWTATRTLAQALAPRVRVNAIGPGPVLRSIHQTDDDFERESRSTLLGRGASTDEIAAAVRFILATPSLTGQMIALDGGQHLT
ncbi:SDR family oxidoreductase [Hyphomicrobium sp. MC1]|uniref:SDR family oxidoreductase n=1 Tax=Hyphomicrobium sp. (strain MC1) TaxID=717785 RepID=UPI000213F6DA|nr:SDR family oxidoreductase [Hyphomicrobium sp. MC1]CCB66202.1 Short-chain dehydrogenase/reductase SDR [Hyphomicrobium sp. MC1]